MGRELWAQLKKLTNNNPSIQYRGSSDLDFQREIDKILMASKKLTAKQEKPVIKSLSAKKSTTRSKKPLSKPILSERKENIEFTDDPPEEEKKVMRKLPAAKKKPRKIPKELSPPKRRKQRVQRSKRNIAWGKLIDKSGNQPGIEFNTSSLDDINNELRKLGVFVPTKAPPIKKAGRKFTNVREQLNIITRPKFVAKDRKIKNAKLVLWEELLFLTNGNPGVKLSKFKARNLAPLRKRVVTERKKSSRKVVLESKEKIAIDDAKREVRFEKIKDDIKNKEILRDRINDFLELRIQNNASSLEGLYASIVLLMEEKGSIPNITLFFQDMTTNKIRFVTIDSVHLDTLSAFIDRIREISSGGDENGSDPIFDETHQLILNRYDAIFIDVLLASCSKNKNYSFLCEVENVKKTGDNTCINDSLAFIGYPCDYKINDIGKLIEYINESELPIILIENKMTVSRDEYYKLYMQGDRKLFTIDMKIGKKIRKKKIKLSNLNRNYRLYHTNTVNFTDDEDEWGRLPVNPADVRYIVFSRDENHVAPCKIYQEKIIYRHDLYVSDKQEIYTVNKDTPKKLLSRSQIKNYMYKSTINTTPKKKSTCEHRYLVIDYETVVEWLLKGIMKPYSLSVLDLNEEEMKYLPKFDELYKNAILKGWIAADDRKWYEKSAQYTTTIIREEQRQIGWVEREIKSIEGDMMTPEYEIKEITVRNYNKTPDGKIITDIATKKHVESFWKFVEHFREIRSKAKTHIGWDCTSKMMEHICNEASKDMQPQYTILTYNGASFDHIICLNDLLMNNKYSDKVSNIMFTHNKLHNFHINGRHEFLDLARHCTGSLKDNCKDYKIDLFAKKSIDFRVMQSLYDRGLLDKMMDIYNGKLDINDLSDDVVKDIDMKIIDDLVEYNDYDVLSLATLYSKYSHEMESLVNESLKQTHQKIEENPFQRKKIRYDCRIHKHKTIGSLIYGALKFYWKHDIDVKMPSFVQQKMAILKVDEEEKIYEREIDGEIMPVDKEVNIELTDEDREKSEKKVVENKVRYKYNEETHKKNERLYKVHNDMKKYRTAGRVECPNGIVKLLTRARSLDITSSYPYEMAVDQVYYPCGDIVEIDKYSDLPADKMSFWYCDIDQKILRDKGLLNLIAEKTPTENLWGTTAVLKNYLITDIMINAMVKYGMKIGTDIKIHNGIYFTDRIKSCVLFKPLLVFMKAKNQEDEWKRTGDPRFNKARRTTTKLALNVPSGKIIEKIHIDKIVEIKNGLQFHELENNDKINKVNTIKIVGGRIFCSYTLNEKDMLHSHRPIYWGCLVYVYAQLNLYHNTLAAGYNFDSTEGEEKRVKRQVEYRSGLLACDTDAGKMSDKSAKICVERMKKLNVSHWPEVEEIDERYKEHKMYDPNSKIFGAFEDEFVCYNNVNFVLAKKNYSSFFNPKLPHEKPTKKSELEEYNKLVSNGDIATLEFRFKGINPKSLVIDTHLAHIGGHMVVEKNERYEISSDQKAYNYYSNDTIIANTRITGKRCFEYFDRLAKGETLYILCQSFRKQLNNMKRNVHIDDLDNHNKQFNTISLSYTLKKICVVKDKKIDPPKKKFKANIVDGGDDWDD